MLDPSAEKSNADNYQFFSGARQNVGQPTRLAFQRRRCAPTWQLFARS